MPLQPQVLLNIYRSAVVIRDRLCIGDTVQLRYGSGGGRRGVVKQFLDLGIVMIEQEFVYSVSNVGGSTEISVYCQLYNILRLFLRRISSRLRGSIISLSSQPPGTQPSVNGSKLPRAT